MVHDRDKIEMAMNRLRLLEDDIAAGRPVDLADFCANMRLRLEHGSPGDTIACFALGADDTDR